MHINAILKLSATRTDTVNSVAEKICLKHTREMCHLCIP